MDSMTLHVSLEFPGCLSVEEGPEDTNEKDEKHVREPSSGLSSGSCPAPPPPVEDPDHKPNQYLPERPGQSA